MPKIGWMLARAGSFVLYYSGGLRLFERIDRGTRPAPRCTVLNYHRVSGESPGYRDIAVAPGTFRSHVAYLVDHGYAFLTLSQYHEHLAGGRALERDSVLLTFDDGYRDNYLEAGPVLREFGVPAAIFLCTGPLETGTPLWWDRVASAVRTLKREGVSGVERVDGVPRDVSGLIGQGLKGGDHRTSRAIGATVDLLKDRPTDQREAIIAALETAAKPDGDEGIMLTWDMVREMHETGIAFGAHSVTHPDFSRLSAEAARAEISMSKSSIESHLGVEVDSFAYPYGKKDYFDASTLDSLRACGIRWAYTTENGRNEPGSDPLALRRDGMRDVPVYVLAVRLAGVFEHPLLARLRKAIEGRRGSR